MPFTVEDGSGKSDANAYVSVAFVDAWFSEQGGHDTWDAAGSEDKQHSIVRATRYIDQRFASLFPGHRTHRTQALEWPRESVPDGDSDQWINSDQIPSALQRACAEYAARAAAGDLLTDPAESREVSEEQKTVGPITTRQKFRETAMWSGIAGNHALKSYPSADLWIEPLLVNPAAAQLQKV